MENASIHEGRPLAQGWISKSVITCLTNYLDRWEGPNALTKLGSFPRTTDLHISDFKPLRRKILNPKLFAQKLPSILEIEMEVDFRNHSRPPFFLHEQINLRQFLKTNLKMQSTYWTTEFDADLFVLSDHARLIFADNSEYSRDPEYVLLHFLGITADIRRYISGKCFPG